MTTIKTTREKAVHVATRE